jgi:hypothetical protein
MLRFLSRSKQRRGFVRSAGGCEALECRVVPSGGQGGAGDDGGNGGFFTVDGGLAGTA